MAEDVVDLKFLARRIERLTTEVGTLKDDMGVMMAILQRVDGTLSGLVNEIRATHSQQSRLAARVAKLEEPIDG